MSILIFVVVITIFVSSQCSLYEAVLYSTRLGTLEAAKAKGKKRPYAAKMIEMKSQISVPLAAILILNTIANTAGATIAGMYAHQVLGANMVPLFSVIFTLGILFFAEIIPKTMGAVHWRKIWPYIVWPLTVMKYGLYPLILISQKFTEMLTRRRAAPHITEEEILGVIRLGEKGGEISRWESMMLHNIINLETIKVTEIMTPRTVMFTLDGKLTLEEAIVKAGKKGFTRIPIYMDDKENIIGYIIKDELNSAKYVNQPKTQLSSLAKPIPIVSENDNCLALLAAFLKKRLHISIIMDEFGGVEGLVTLEDLIETVLGAEIVDENDDVVDLQKLARNRRKKRMEEKFIESESGDVPDIDKTDDEAMETTDRQTTEEDT